MLVTGGADEDTARANVLAVLDTVREELEAIARAADEALRTGDLDRFAQLDLARAKAARDALLAASADAR